MKLKVVSTVLIVAILALGFLALAVEYGTQSDPLVSLSYINDVLKPELLSEVDKASDDVSSAISAYEGRVDKKVDEVTDRMSAEITDSDLAAIAAQVPTAQKQNAPFTTLDLTAGKSITLKSGCELLSRGDLSLKSGNLIDVTAGEETSAIKANHLYTAIDTATVTAKGKVTVFVRGDYILY